MKICRRCNLTYEDSSLYCKECGDVLEEVYQKGRSGTSSKKGRIPVSTIVVALIALAIAGAWIVNAFVLKNSAKGMDYVAKAKGSSSPEKLIQSFTDAVADQDLEGVLQLCPAKQMSENYKILNTLNNYTRWKLTGQMIYPEGNDFGDYMNALYKQNSFEEQVSNFCMSFLADPAYLKGSEVDIEDEDEMMDYVKMVDLDQLKNLELVRTDICKLYEAHKVSDVTKSLYKNAINTYGCDALSEYMVLYKLEDDYFQSAVTVAEYDGKYYLTELRGDSTQCGNSYLSLVEETSKSGYKSLLSIDQDNADAISDSISDSTSDSFSDSTDI